MNINFGSNSIGQIFTPRYIAEFMVKNVSELLKRNRNIDEIENIKVLEPSAGQGIFLEFLTTHGFSNIVAYELDMSLKERLRIQFPSVDFRFNNFFSSNPSEKYDLIIGNPPYLGQNYNAELFQDYVKKYPICAKFFVGNMDLFYYFIHLGIEKLKPRGLLSFITTSYWITKSNKTGIKFLKPDIINKCYLLQYIDLTSLKLFKNAKGQHNCIISLRKKTKQQQLNLEDEEIDILYIKNPQISSEIKEEVYKDIFRRLSQRETNNNIISYRSAITNNNLSSNGSWNLLYPKEVAELVTKIEQFCVTNHQISFLRDYFIIRNGIIFIKDDIFVLIAGKTIKLVGDKIFIKIKSNLEEISNTEKSKLKKIYKSKAIRKFGYLPEKFTGYGIFFNKDEFSQKSTSIRNKSLKRKYPVLSKYIEQFREELEGILKNAKENPADYFFPRRGAFVWSYDKNNQKELVNMESKYDNDKKIFTKFITESNLFGFSTESYYATSDTYFLWPKYPDIDINYPLVLAYLNSKIVTFLFKAKNVKIKRSKTKLENLIPIPNFQELASKRQEILLIIEFLSRIMIVLHSKENLLYLSDLIQKTKTLINGLSKPIKSIFDRSIYSLDLKNPSLIQEALDALFFKLFNISEDQVDYLMRKYYDH